MQFKISSPRGLNIIMVQFIFILSIISSCIKQDNCPRYVRIPANILPVQLEYHLGDTITIVSKFFKDVILFDSEEKKLGIASMSGVEWKPVTVIFRIDTLGQGGMSTINKYFYFLDNTNYDYHMHLVTADVSILEGEYNYEKDTFSLLVKIIPKAIGTYFLRQGSNTGQDGNQIFHGKCNGNNVDAWVDMNKFQNNNDNNIELLTESPDTFFNSWVLSNRATNIDHFGGFCFRVIP